MPLREAVLPSDTPAGMRFWQAYQKAWYARHEALAQLSSRGAYRFMEGSGHAIQLDKPQARPSTPWTKCSARSTPVRPFETICAGRRGRLPLSTDVQGSTWRSARPRPAKSAFIYVGLEQVTNQRYMSPRANIWSSAQTDVFVAKSARPFCRCPRTLDNRPVPKPRAGPATVASGATAMPRFRIPYWYQ
jgi:hypothetical protein